MNIFKLTKIFSICIYVAIKETFKGFKAYKKFIELFYNIKRIKYRKKAIKLYKKYLLASIEYKEWRDKYVRK